MALIYEGNEGELLKRNREYLEIAKRNGFSIRNNSMDSGGDWTVIYWIDELDDRKEDLPEFLRILSSFRRWLTNGVTTLGVGKDYDLISGLEKTIEEYKKNGIDLGITINSDTVGCLLAISRKYRAAGLSINAATISDITTKMILYRMNGIPIDYKLADKYSVPVADKTAQHSKS